MKAKITICLMISFITLSCGQQKKSSIEGAWNLVYAQKVSADTIEWEFPKDFPGGSELKIWSKGYVLYYGHWKMDSAVIDGGGGGPYKKLNGNIFEESIQYFSVPSVVGSHVRMLLEIKNDTLVQIYPVDENGQIDKSNYREQKRVRLD